MDAIKVAEASVAVVKIPYLVNLYAIRKNIHMTKFMKLKMMISFLCILIEYVHIKKNTASVRYYILPFILSAFCWFLV